MILAFAILAAYIPASYEGSAVTNDRFGPVNASTAKCSGSLDPAYTAM